METREIPQSEWLGYLNEFSKQHEGGCATMEIIGNDIGAQLQGRYLSFVGVSAEKPTSDNSVISFMFGEEPEEHMEHRIYGAEHLRIMTSDGGLRDILEVEATDGTKTILQIQPLGTL